MTLETPPTGTISRRDHDIHVAPTPPAPTSSGSLTLKQLLQILSTFVVFFNTWGILLTFGVFQAHYTQALLPQYSSSSISWISTTCAFIILSAGIVTGPLYDHGFYVALLLFGSLLQVFGLMMLSLSTEYYQLFFAQAICVGLGAGIVFTPSVAAAASCLTKPSTRAKAMGLMACGSSIGGIIYPIMFRTLVASSGFPWAVRSIAFLTFGMYLISYLALINLPPKPPMRRQFFDASAFVDKPFMMLAIASSFSATAFYIPLLYLPVLAKMRIPNVSPNLRSDLLSILNGASVIGRLSAGVLAARYGPTETISISLVFGSIILFCWIAVKTLAGVIAWAVFWGMISGVLVALPGAFVPLFCPSLVVIGTRSGMYWASVGIGLLIGSPIGGVIYDPKAGKRVWWRLQVFAGIFMMAAAVLTVYPIWHLRRKSKASTTELKVESGEKK